MRVYWYLGEELHHQSWCCLTTPLSRHGGYRGEEVSQPSVRPHQEAVSAGVHQSVLLSPESKSPRHSEALLQPIVSSV